jgi:hypothetical protein
LEWLNFIGVQGRMDYDFLQLIPRNIIGASNIVNVVINIAVELIFFYLNKLINFGEQNQ